MLSFQMRYVNVMFGCLLLRVSVFFLGFFLMSVSFCNMVLIG